MRIFSVVAFASIVLAWSVDSKAIDGCSLSDKLVGGQTMVALLSDDVALRTVPELAAGRTGFSSPTAVGLGTNLPNMAVGASIAASLSDVHLEVWAPASLDISDTSLDYGGNGTFYRGSVGSVKCPKGLNCAAFLPPQVQRKNQAWRCMRQFPNEAVTVPVQTSTYFSGGSLQDEWVAQVTRSFTEANEVSRIHEPRGYVTIEPSFATCKRLGNCNTGADWENYYNNTDMLRLHWEAAVDPDLTSKDCVEGVVAECLFFSPVCIYDLVTDDAQVCEVVVGTKHVVVDVWLEPRASNGASVAPLQFVKKTVRVGVQTGSGSAQLSAAISQKLAAMDIGKFVASGIFAGIGERLCAAGLAPSAECNNFLFFGANTGAKFLGKDSPLNPDGTHQTWPGRVELMFDPNPHNRSPAIEFWGATGLGTLLQSPTTMVINMNRQPQL